LKYGSTNVEKSFDSYLRGNSGIDSLETFGDQLLHRPVVGNDVVLTIDSSLQKVAEEALGNSKGAIIAMDPRSGEILALASHPYYDPNKLEQDWNSIQNDQGTPLIDRATQGLYVPGSTFKTATIAAAIDAGIVNPNDKLEYELKAGPPAYHTEVFNGFSVYCANHRNAPAGKLSLTVADAYAASCNVAFAELGVKLGQQRFTDYANRFGVGEQIPLDIAGNSSQLSTKPNLLRDGAALASTSFGQGELLVSPLQMALITNAIADLGSIMPPHVVKEVRGTHGVVWKPTLTPWRKPIQPASALAVRDMMVESVDQGWATGAQISGIKVAGKTGTAEAQPGKPAHAWFTAFAPADNPTISVVVIKENAGSGSAEAIPAAKKVLEAALSNNH
jgi:peptidoglycan glycosyltransferase